MMKDMTRRGERNGIRKNGCFTAVMVIAADPLSAEG